MQRRLLALSLLTITTAFALFVWPTRYHYDRIQMPGETTAGPVFPVRIDRFSGMAETLLPEMLNDSRHNMALGWVGTPGVPLPAEALAELRSHVLIDVEPVPYAQIFNTTTWRVTKLRWLVTSGAGKTQASGPQPTPFDQSVFIEPHTVARLYLELGRFGHGASIAFDTAWGQPIFR
jgi:hypothetical protein